jgi:hypothetical protein
MKKRTYPYVGSSGDGAVQGDHCSASDVVAAAEAAGITSLPNPVTWTQLHNFANALLARATGKA